MRSVSGRNFGLLIAYVLPGMLVLLGLAAGNADVRGWLATAAAQSGGATVGGFLYVTLAAVAAGLTASTVRWAVIDPLHHATGVERPHWDDSKLQAQLGAFDALVENHYRYYQNAANSVVGLATILVGRHFGGTGSIRFMSLDTAIVAVCILFWAGSRDSLKRYYRRTSVLLGAQHEGEVLYDERTQSTAGTGPEGVGSRASVRRCAKPRQVQEALQTTAEGMCIRVEGWPTFIVGQKETRILLEIQTVCGHPADASESA